jgi:hypothetical protein
MVRRGLALAVATAFLLAASPAVASGAALVPLAPSSAWESTPIHAASPPGDPRLFVVERGGGVRIVENGALLQTPFLTVPNVDTNGERGLLSIAFSPNYATSGLFYVFTVAAGPDALDPSGLEGDLRVVEYRRSATDPSLADPASARLVLKQPHGGATNHNGGQLAFGPEGLLYVTMGDAANGSNAQSLANDLGKVLRIDPREQPGGASFGIPASNPFVGTMGARAEIYGLGLRNPYRASFGPDGELVLPDVGQATWEEVNLGHPTGTPAATTLAGANLGWPNCEATCSPPNSSFVDPIFQYNHSGPAEATGCAIIGGYVVRDPALTGLTGRYLYGDLCRSDLRTLDLDQAGADPRPAGISLPTPGEGPLGFGEDSRGCVYVMAEGTVFRVAESATAGAACPPPGGGASPTTAPLADTARPRLSLRAARRQHLRRFVTVFAGCDEACSLRATGALGFSIATASRSLGLIPAVGHSGPAIQARLRLRLRKRTLKQAKRARRHGARLKARVRIEATDPSGNSTVRSLRIVLVGRSR